MSAAQSPLFRHTAEFDPAWKHRISHLASFIDTSGPVLDIGCGMMWLEPMLTRGNAYIPLDYIRRDDRTMVVDLNTDGLPEVDAEFVYMSGVLEYLRDVPGFLRQVALRRYRRILLTYCSMECWWKMSVRQSLNWVSHESIESLMQALLPAYSLVTVQRVEQHAALVVQLRES